MEHNAQSYPLLFLWRIETRVLTKKMTFKLLRRSRRRLSDSLSRCLAYQLGTVVVVPFEATLGRLIVAALSVLVRRRACRVGLGGAWLGHRLNVCCLSRACCVVEMALSVQVGLAFPDEVSCRMRCPQRPSRTLYLSC